MIPIRIEQIKKFKNNNLAKENFCVNLLVINGEISIEENNIICIKPYWKSDISNNFLHMKVMPVENKGLKTKFKTEAKIIMYKISGLSLINLMPSLKSLLKALKFISFGILFDFVIRIKITDKAEKKKLTEFMNNITNNPEVPNRIPAINGAIKFPIVWTKELIPLASTKLSLGTTVGIIVPIAGWYSEEIKDKSITKIYMDRIER